SKFCGWKTVARIWMSKERLPHWRGRHKTVLKHLTRPLATSYASWFASGARSVSCLLSLPSIRMPTEATEQALAEALVRQRLVVRDGKARIRLVHEAVVHHWPEASAWLKEERIHLDRASALAADAREWQTRGFEEAFLQTAGQRDVDRAANVLSWFF